MPQIWKPSAVGKLFTSSPDWSLSLDRVQFALRAQDSALSGSVVLLERVIFKPGIFWTTLQIARPNQQPLQLDGIANGEARRLQEAVRAALETKRYQDKVAELIQQFDQQTGQFVGWANSTIGACKAQLARRGWLGFEFIVQLIDSKPQELTALLAHPEVLRHVESQPEPVQQAIRLWQRSLPEFVKGINRRHAEKVAQDDTAFFDSVERSPLTDEQRQAVICLDNRVLLVASAGSCKTSTMVAKAGYALKHGYFAPDRILLLAFNSDAATELRTRIQDRLAPLGLPADKVVAKTFHAFGLDVIGKATGKRPSLAPWVENGQDIEALLKIVDDLKDLDPGFRSDWDLFRIVYSQDLPKFGQEQENPDSWDNKNNRGGFWTLNNEVVKSRGEVLLANWLFYNGVKYVYEPQYEHDTADASHRQYQPDFYLPGANAYLEHWAVDARGEPPSTFLGYKEGMEWKRQLHAQHGTRLLETTMAGLWSGKAFQYLSNELPKLGITLQPDPDRPVQGRNLIENRRLARTFRSFLTHAKSNRLTLAELRARHKAGVAGEFQIRHDMFLRLFERIWSTWEEKLRSSRCIDFEDMLNIATDCVEGGQYQSPYELVMVDEFQDASQARARLVRSLVSGRDKYLFAVGDDWQSINRFAGADLSVMTDFESTFGKAVTLRLETTFRCPPSLCKLSSAFVQKNPRQIPKAVRSPKLDIAHPVRIMTVESEHHIRSAVEMRTSEIAREAASLGRRVKVYLLGRYRKDEQDMPRSYDTKWVELEFITVHSSKGLEADHVILPRVTSETLGFPSRVSDDPVLKLAMPRGDDFEYAEDRRLFYVALTRAKLTATLVTIAHKQSPFVIELVKEQQVQFFDTNGSTTSREICPKCGKGFLAQRSGKFGPFQGCSTYPRCKFTQNIPEGTGL